MYNALNALNFIHSSNMAHRNICPQNVLIDSACQVQIGGFNQVKALPKNFDTKNPTRKLRGILDAELTEYKVVRDDEEPLIVAPTFIRTIFN